MSPRRWILLLIFYIAYLMLGASIYYHMEHSQERQQRQEDLRQRIEINTYLVEQLADLNETAQDEVLTRITRYCGKPVTNYQKDEFTPPYTWTFYHAFFFAFTVCSTVGYGNLSPTTVLGRWLMIIYSIIGIPVNGILFAVLGDYFGRTFEAIYRRYKKYKLARDSHYVPARIGLITIIIIALIPGITVFMLLPSWVFSYVEKWDYSLALYYCYVTMTTIGFGDYVPTFEPTQPEEFGGWFVVYEIFVIIWFIFSLGYLLMIMTFITRGLQSKKLSRLEQQLSTNIKATQNKIWTGVTKDVGYLRRILNELYISKVKPVYSEPERYVLPNRCNSCPELTMYRMEPAPPPRKRAFSESYDVDELRADATPFRMVHASSDTEVDKFDRTKSFENAETFRRTTELLGKVVTALAGVRPPEEDTTLGAAGMFGGYHGFSDSQILESEWSFGEIPKPRGRAASDFNIPPKWRQAVRRQTAQPNEWTWSGDNNQIQAAINDRHRQKDRENLYRTSFGQPPADYIVNIDEEEVRKTRPKKFSMPDGLRRIFPFKKRLSEQHLGDSDPNRKFSVVSVPETQQQSRDPALDYYSTVTSTPGYYQNGKPVGLPPLGAAESYPSETSISSQLSNVGPNANGVASPGYQRNVPKKRRESVFAQKQSRRSSVYPPSSAAALSQQRRDSHFLTNERRDSFVAPLGGHPPARRDSLFAAAAPSSRRPSIFSVASNEDMDVLENTTLADLIRALEAVHTQSVLDDEAPMARTAAQPRNIIEDVFRSDRKNRKKSLPGIDPPQMSPIFGLLGGDDKRTLETAAANRLYARRATIVGATTGAPLGVSAAFARSAAAASGTGASSVLTRRRRSSVQMAAPPGSYIPTDAFGVSSTAIPEQPPTASTQALSAVSKFKRRFSVRPTALQIPPGQAPPAGVSLSQLPTQMAAVGSVASPQTALQRRMSLRPSPLARELNTPSSATGFSGTSAGNSDTNIVSPTNATGIATAASSTTRLLPPAGVMPRPLYTISSSTHSPLSRIAQISQAQRKSSAPEGLGLIEVKNQMKNSV